MAAPATTTRITPAGIRLIDGYRSTLACAADPDVSLWEIEVGTPGLDGGDAINTTTMWNNTWRTMTSRALITLTEFTVKFAYDPAIYSQMVALLNVEGAFTRTYPDGSTLDFFAFFKKLEFDALVEGTFPTGTATITPTNYDPVNHVEAAPVLTSVSGT